MRHIVFSASLAACILLVGCHCCRREAAGGEAKAVKMAVCKLEPASGSQVSGKVSFTETESGVLVKAVISGLTPGKHGFHIHENGDCSSPDAKSAGGHFNPDAMQHGGPDSAMHHAGDMGNVEAGQDGNVNLEWKDANLSFEGPHSILGRAVVVHEKEDDLKSQPAGNAGNRVACGVIGAISQ